MEDTWVSRELPVLNVVVNAFEDGNRRQLRVAELTELCGLPESDVQAALRSLDSASPPYLEAPRPGWGAAYPAFITGVTERARRAVGQWPTPENLVDRLAEAFGQAAEHETDPQKRGRLRDVANMIGQTGRGIAVAVAAQVILRQTGMG